MDDNSWLMLPRQDPAFMLPPDLARHDPLGARDCGWVEQMRPFIRQFCPAGGLVIDPFCGFGTTLLAAHLEGRRGMGVELEPDRARIAGERMRRAGAREQAVTAGDILAVAPALPMADLILTNIPYFGCRWQREDERPSQLYGTETYGAFLDRMDLVFKALKARLREGGFLIVMAENLRIGEHFVPMAWDVGRILSERYDLVDERILLYERPAQAMEGGVVRNNRAHEVALIAQHHARPVDLDGTWDCIRTLASAVEEVIVYGSFARWLDGEDLARLPSDADLLVPNDVDVIARVVDWLQSRGFQVTRWGAPASSEALAIAARQAHYLRARRLGADGRLCLIDVCFEDAVLDYARAAAMAGTIGGVRVLPSGREMVP